MAAGFRSVRLDQRAVDQLLRSPNREVGQHLRRVGGAVTKAGRELADQRLNSSTTARFRDGSATGRYADSFKTTTLRAGGELRTRITNTARQATYLENGTPPHVILPRRPGGVLVFTTGSGVGGPIFARRVLHPGTRPYHIMRDALRLGVKRANGRSLLR